MKQMLQIVGMGLVALMMAGCWSSNSGKVYSRDAAKVAHEVRIAVIEGIGEARIEGTKTPIGAAAGGVMGGVLGSAIGGGSGRDIAIAAGALAGAAVGGAAEEGLTGKKAYELTVTFEDDGKTITIVQQADEEWSVGQRVKVLRAPDGTQRVRPL